MGVIRKLGNAAPVIHMSNESVNSLGINSEPSTPPNEPVESDVIAPRRRDPAQLVQRLQNHSRRSRLGVRKTRRAEMARDLQVLVEDDAENSSEPSFSDFRPNNEGGFTQLLTSDNNMRVWQYFVSCSEDEQREYLKALSRKCQRSRNTNNAAVGFRGVAFIQNKHTNSGDQNGNKDGITSSNSGDFRSMHPALSPEQRFTMVDSNLRNVLKKKHTPLGLLDHLEDEIVTLFCDDPSAIYITEELSSFDRLLLHAICQYNLLHSHSVTIAKMRRTKVENCEPSFLPPSINLSQYLENVYRGK